MRLFVILLRSSLRVSFDLGLRFGWQFLQRELMTVVPDSTRLFITLLYSSAVSLRLNSFRPLVSPHLLHFKNSDLVSFFMCCSFGSDRFLSRLAKKVDKCPLRRPMLSTVVALCLSLILPRFFNRPSQMSTQFQQFKD